MHWSYRDLISDLILFPAALFRPKERRDRPSFRLVLDTLSGLAKRKLTSRCRKAKQVMDDIQRLIDILLLIAIVPVFYLSVVTFAAFGAMGAAVGDLVGSNIVPSWR